MASSLSLLQVPSFINHHSYRLRSTPSSSKNFGTPTFPHFLFSLIFILAYQYVFFLFPFSFLLLHFRELSVCCNQLLVFQWERDWLGRQRCQESRAADWRETASRVVCSNCFWRIHCAPVWVSSLVFFN